MADQAELAEESEETRGGAAAVGAAASIAAMVQRASALGADVAKMVGKAREADPDKQVPLPLLPGGWTTVMIRGVHLQPCTMHLQPTAWQPHLP